MTEINGYHFNACIVDKGTPVQYTKATIQPPRQAMAQKQMAYTSEKETTGTQLQ